jgi:hypothetical protein
VISAYGTPSFACQGICHGDQPVPNVLDPVLDNGVVPLVIAQRTPESQSRRHNLHRRRGSQLYKTTPMFARSRVSLLWFRFPLPLCLVCGRNDLSVGPREWNHKRHGPSHRVVCVKGLSVKEPLESTNWPITPRCVGRYQHPST